MPFRGLSLLHSPSSSTWLTLCSRPPPSLPARVSRRRPFGTTAHDDGHTLLAVGQLISPKTTTTTTNLLQPLHPSIFPERIPTIPHIPARRHARQTQFLHPQLVTEKDFFESHLADYTLPDSDHVSDWVGTQVGYDASPVENSPILNFCSTSTKLFRALLRLLHNQHSHNTTAALHFHAQHPVRIRSARSYNLLITHTLRSASFKMTRRLLSEMRLYGIRGNIETHKLHVRLLALTGHWEAAWRLATQPPPSHFHRSRLSSLGSSKRKGNVILPIWLECFRTPRRSKIFQSPSSSHPTSVPDADIVGTSRFQRLMSAFPKLTPRETSRMPVRVIHYVTMTMLRSGRRQSALDLVTAYANGLPPHLSFRRWRPLMDIVHLFIRFTSAKKGIGRHLEAMRSCQELIKMHTCLRPTSTTLYLLLGTLRRTMHCGTAAYKLLRTFRSHWGPRVEDRRVRRRVASYALKEGRLDIAKLMIDTEKGSRVAKELWTLETEAMGGSPRVPRRCDRRRRWKLVESKAQEETKWNILIGRMWKKETEG